MKTQLLLIIAGIALSACANVGNLGHISNPSKTALNIIPDHKLDLIADRANGLKTLTPINDEKVIENYKQNHKTTAVCQKFSFATSEASTDPAARTTTLTLLNGERVLYRDLCFVQKSNPDNSNYLTMPIQDSEQPAAAAQAQ